LKPGDVVIGKLLGENLQGVREVRPNGLGISVEVLESRETEIRVRFIVAAISQWAPGAVEILSQLQQLVFGLLIIGFLVYEPHGLVVVWRRIRRFFHLWPFRT